VRALDLFCGAGGAAMGLHRAGFDVVGVDIAPQKHYPFEFHQADAMTYPLDGFDFIWASPPCQRYSIASVLQISRGKEYPDLVAPTRDMLIASGTAYVIENVMGAPLLPSSIRLCGLEFGLRVFRHRLFEPSDGLVLVEPTHPSHKGHRVGVNMCSVAGHGGPGSRRKSHGTAQQWRDAMGIEWMTRDELAQSVPPAYSEYIGRQVIQQLRTKDAAREETGKCVYN
jgi:DNA (cytosine-5)-methyltransferase 1